MKIRKLSIKNRLCLSFGILVFLLIFTGVLSVISVKTLRNSTIEIEKNTIPSLKYIETMRNQISSLRVIGYRYLISDQISDREIERNKFERILEEIKYTEKEYITVVTLPGELKEFEIFKVKISNYIDGIKLIFHEVELGNIEHAKNILLYKLPSIFNDINIQVDNLSIINNSYAREMSIDSTEEYGFVILGTTILIVLGVSLSIIMAIKITNSITEPLNSAIEISGHISNRNLALKIIRRGNDELTSLTDSITKMQSNLHQTITKIHFFASKLSQTTDEMTYVTENQTKSLLHQNEEIKQAASAINMMSNAIDEVAKNAVETSQTTSYLSLSANQGRVVVQRTLQDIYEINEDIKRSSETVNNLAKKSREVGGMLNVIRTIADQINLLALNAAIEAARAGAAGRGFAVVAEEIRALAIRTQSTTKEINQMIESINDIANESVMAMNNNTVKANESLNQARLADLTLEKIFIQIKKINESNLFIAASAEQQAVISREIDGNIINISDISNNSSMGSKMISAYMDELVNLSENLYEIVNDFNLG